MNELNKNLYGYDSFENAYEVSNYPWGFRYRTIRKYWIETTKHGDRVCYSTLHPTNGKWCNVKKSTYSAVKILYLDDNDHVRSFGIELGWSDQVAIYNFIKQIDQARLNKDQQKKICEAKTIAHVQSKVKVEYTINAPKLPEAEQAAKDQEQQQIKDKLNKYANFCYSECLTKNNLV